MNLIRTHSFVTTSQQKKSQLPEQEKNEAERLVDAANRIQKFWRKYIDIQVFKYYKDLVMFENQGDPALMMKYINPNEAKLIDSASGIHIKFRLAGTTFPPTIHYKIFTHRPVQDLGANAPRNYVRVRQKPAALQNNRTPVAASAHLEAETLEGWYKRIENNGWRPVSTKHLLNMNMDFYFGMHASDIKEVFHHSKQQRRQDVELKKKRLKIDWMKKMYKNGMLKAKGKYSAEESEMIDAAARNFLKTLDESKQVATENVAESEVDELLKWTNGLSFDDYSQTWKSVGTTAASEKLAVERIRIRSQLKDAEKKGLTSFPDK